MSEAVILAIFGILSLMITVVLVGLFKIINNQDASQKSLIKSLDENTKSNKEIAEATKKSAKEAEQRNGHLAEITVQSKEQVLNAISTIAEQHVIKQTVDEQTIKR